MTKEYIIYYEDNIDAKYIMHYEYHTYSKERWDKMYSNISHDHRLKITKLLMVVKD